MTYEAIYMPGDGSERDPSKGGFKTEKEAWDYALGYFCDDCLKKIKKGQGSSCDAEWMIDEEDDNEILHKAKILTKEEVEANRSSAYDYLDL